VAVTVTFRRLAETCRTADRTARPDPMPMVAKGGYPRDGKHQPA